jgi:uncharacterized membrane protein
MSFILQIMVLPIIWLFWGITLECIIKGTWGVMVVYFVIDIHDKTLPWSFYERT